MEENENVSRNFSINVSRSNLHFEEELEDEEPFISIYRKEKITFFFKEITINCISLDICGILFAGYMMEFLSYYFFVAFWIIYDWSFSIFLVYHISQEKK